MSEFVCPPEHKHGVTGTCYVVHLCRCDDCKGGRRAYEQRRRRERAYGIVSDRYVPAAPVRDHVNMLRRAGMGWKRIAEVSGVGKTAVSQLIYGRKGPNKDPRKGEVLQRMLRTNAEKLLAVRPTMGTLRAGALVPARGFQRRVQALMCLGWSMSKLANVIGVERANFGQMMRRDRIENRHFANMAVFYRDNWNIPAPNVTHRDKIAFSRSVKYAKVHGFVPPMGWDDIDRDRPRRHKYGAEERLAA